jgi:hypothetical protein
MSKVVLQAIIGTAFVDREFCEEFLDGKRPAILSRFGLTDEEREAALAIRSNSIQEFARGMCDWMGS